MVRREGPSLGLRRKRGETTQAIGRSRGGRTTKIHALTDRFCLPLAFLLTGGNVADCTAGARLLRHLPACRNLLADKGYDSDAIRRQVEAAGAAPNIPAKVNRGWKPPFSPVLYRQRNVVERMVCRLKNWRRIATRYDRLAATYLAAVCIAATVSYWLGVHTEFADVVCARRDRLYFSRLSFEPEIGDPDLLNDIRQKCALAFEFPKSAVRRKAHPSNAAGAVTTA